MIINKVVKQAMSEDLKPSGDITSQLIKNNKKIKAKIISNQNCIIGGLSFAKEAFIYSDKNIRFKIKTKDGQKIKRGKVVAMLNGKAKGILKSERVALNFLSFTSGVATLTKKSTRQTPVIPHASQQCRGSVFQPPRRPGPPVRPPCA